MHATRIAGILSLAVALTALVGCDNGNEWTPDDTTTDGETDTTTDMTTDTTDDPTTDPAEDPTEDPTTDEETDGVETVYPDFIGEWEYTGYDSESGDPDFYEEITYTATTFETLWYNYTGPTTTEFGWGMRGDYAISGDTVLSTLTEASTDGTTWFTSTSDPSSWSDFIDGMFGGSDTFAGIYAVSITGEELFMWSDDYGDSAWTGMLTRTGGTATAAVGYPSTLGDWESVTYASGTTDPESRNNTSVEATTIQVDFYSYSTDWDYDMGMRWDYVTSGSLINQTLSEASNTGATWFDETSDPSEWSDFVTNILDGTTTAESYWAVSPSGDHFFVASDDWGGGMMVAIMYDAL